MESFAPVHLERNRRTGGSDRWTVSITTDAPSDGLEQTARERRGANVRVHRFTGPSCRPPCPLEIVPGFYWVFLFLFNLLSNHAVVLVTHVTYGIKNISVGDRVLISFYCTFRLFNLYPIPYHLFYLRYQGNLLGSLFS